MIQSDRELTFYKGFVMSYLFKEAKGYIHPSHKLLIFDMYAYIYCT